MKQTIPLSVLHRLDSNPGKTALRSKIGDSYGTISSQSVADRIRHYGRGLIAQGIEVGDRVAIMAPNSPEWVYADQGAMSIGAVTVPVYHTERIDALLHILRDSKSRVLFIRSILLAKELADRLKDVPELKQVILLGGGYEQDRFLSLTDFLTRGIPEGREKLNRRLEAGQSQDLATLIYTSGTTGPPKGVALTHANILENVKAALTVFDIGPHDSCLSFLPLSHVFERIDGYYLMLLQGSVIAYAESIDTVPQNLVEVQPTIVISVPRLYEKMYARVMERVLDGPAVKKQLFFAALKIGGAYSKTILAKETPDRFLKFGIAVARRLVFSKLHQKLGGRLRFFISGGAPLVQNVAEFFHAAGIPIYEGYGLTETGAGISANSDGNMRLGSVGKAFPGTEIKIADDGEILLRGPGIFKGYWNLPEQTAEAFDDGWFKTGDIGEVDADGFLSITDRKKDLIVTAGGENVAPQFLENLCKTDKYLSNAMVYGDRKPYLIALLVPNFDNLEKYAKFKGLDYLNECGLIGHPRILDLIRRRLDRLQAGLPAYKQIKRFTLLSRDFSGIEGEVTPTLKIKRKVVATRFDKLIEGMYLAKDHATHDSGFCIIDDREE
jgi:long-chain acyl-CoA synthetase